MLNRGRLPTKEEILEVARKMYVEGCIRDGVEPLTPEDYELRQMGYCDRAKLYLMRNIQVQQLQQKFRLDEINYAENILDRNHYIIISPETLQEPQSLDMKIRTLQRLRDKAMMRRYAEMVK